MDVPAEEITGAKPSLMQATTHTQDVGHPAQTEELPEQHSLNASRHAAGEMPAQAAVQHSPGVSDQTPQHTAPALQADDHNMQAGYVESSNHNNNAATPSVASSWLPPASGNVSDMHQDSLSMLDSARIAQQIAATHDELQNMKSLYTAALAQVDQYYQRIVVLEAEKQQLSNLLSGAQNDIVMLAERLAVAQQKLNQSKAVQDEVQQLKLQLSLYQTELQRLQGASLICNPAAAVAIAADAHMGLDSQLPSTDVGPLMLQPEKTTSSPKGYKPPDHSPKQRKESHNRGRNDAVDCSRDSYERDNEHRGNRGRQDYAVDNRQETDRDMADQGLRKRMRSSLQGSETVYSDSRYKADPYRNVDGYDVENLHGVDNRYQRTRPSTETCRSLHDGYEQQYNVPSKAAESDLEGVQPRGSERNAVRTSRHARTERGLQHGDYGHEHAVYINTTGRDYEAEQRDQEADTRQRSSRQRDARSLSRVEEYETYSKARTRDCDAVHQRDQEPDTRQDRYREADARIYADDRYEQERTLYSRTRSREYQVEEEPGAHQRSQLPANARLVSRNEYEHEYGVYPGVRRPVDYDDAGQQHRELAVRRRSRIVSHIEYEEEYASHHSGRQTDYPVAQERDYLDADDKSHRLTGPRRLPHDDYEHQYTRDQRAGQQREQLPREWVVHATEKQQRYSCQTRYGSFDDRHDDVFEDQSRPRSVSATGVVERDKVPSTSLSRDDRRLPASRERDRSPRPGNQHLFQVTMKKHLHRS